MPGENGPPIATLIGGPGPVALSFDGGKYVATVTNEHIDYWVNEANVDCNPIIGRTINNIVSLALAMRAGLIYVNIHTSLFGEGEVRGQLLK